MVFSFRVLNDLRRTAPHAGRVGLLCLLAEVLPMARPMRRLISLLQQPLLRGLFDSHTCFNSYGHACPCDRAHVKANAPPPPAPTAPRRAGRDLVVHRRRPCSKRHLRVRPRRMASLGR